MNRIKNRFDATQFVFILFFALLTACSQVNSTELQHPANGDQAINVSADEFREAVRNNLSQKEVLKKFDDPDSKESSDDERVSETWVYKLDKMVFCRLNFDNNGTLVGFSWDGTRADQNGESD